MTQGLKELSKQLTSTTNDEKIISDPAKRSAWIEYKQDYDSIIRNLINKKDS